MSQKRYQRLKAEHYRPVDDSRPSRSRSPVKRKRRSSSSSEEQEQEQEVRDHEFRRRRIAERRPRPQDTIRDSHLQGSPRDGFDGRQRDRPRSPKFDDGQGQKRMTNDPVPDEKKPILLEDSESSDNDIARDSDRSYTNSGLLGTVLDRVDHLEAANASSALQHKKSSEDSENTTKAVARLTEAFEDMKQEQRRASVKYEQNRQQDKVELRAYVDDSHKNFADDIKKYLDMKIPDPPSTRADSTASNPPDGQAHGPSPICKQELALLPADDKTRRSSEDAMFNLTHAIVENTQAFREGMSPLRKAFGSMEKQQAQLKEEVEHQGMFSNEVHSHVMDHLSTLQETVDRHEMRILEVTDAVSRSRLNLDSSQDRAASEGVASVPNRGAGSQDDSDDAFYLSESDIHMEDCMEDCM